MPFMLLLGTLMITLGDILWYQVHGVHCSYCIIPALTGPVTACLQDFSDCVLDVGVMLYGQGIMPAVMAFLQLSHTASMCTTPAQARSSSPPKVRYTMLTALFDCHR